MVHGTGTVEVKVVREPRVMRDGYTVWRRVKDDGPTALRVRKVHEAALAKPGEMK